MSFYFYRPHPQKPKEPQKHHVTEHGILSNDISGDMLRDIEEYDEDDEDDFCVPCWMSISGDRVEKELKKLKLSLNDVQFKVYADYTGSVILEVQQLIQTLNKNYDTEMLQYKEKMKEYQEELKAWEKARDEEKRRYNLRELERLEEEKQRLEREIKE